jgi:hypothetical protein
MSVFSRFFGRKEADEPVSGKLIANPQIEHPRSLQVLFPDACRLQSDRLIAEFKSYHRSMSKVQCEIDAELNQEGKMFGMIGWGKHVIRCVGFDLPMPAEAVERCVAPSHYPQELKEQARAHQAHVILFYAGYEESPFEQYVALAATAGVLARLGAMVVLNESGHTSLPAAVLSGVDVDGDIMDLLRSLPIPILYCGFVKYDVEDIPGVWMRTHGAPLLGLPDFAVHAAGHHEGQRYFDIFENIFIYLRDSGSQLAPGHTMQIGEQEYLRVRKPAGEEAFLGDDGDLLVAEVIGPDEING